MDFLSIRITVQSVIAIAEHMRRGCPPGLLGQCLRKNGKVVKDGLIQQLQDAVESGQIELHSAKTCGPQDKIETVLQTSDGLPTLVLSPDNDELLGILTPFDLF